MLSVNTNSLRHLPRRSSKNCDLQFANSDRFKENNSIDNGKQQEGESSDNTGPLLIGNDVNIAVSCYKKLSRFQFP